MTTRHTFTREADSAKVLAYVSDIMRDIETGFHIHDRSVSYVTVERTNDGRAWAIRYGTEYDGNGKG